MDRPIDLKLVGGLTLDEFLHSLEDTGTDFPEGTEIAVLPPINACDPVTDEDSGDEDFVNVNNLPGSQLLAEAEIFHNFDPLQIIFSPRPSPTPVRSPEPVKVNDNEYTSEDDLTLAEIRSRMKKTKSAKSGPIKRHYKWKKRDIEPPNIEIPLVHNVVNNNSPLELFDFFWDEEIINMFLGCSNLYASQHNKPANITKEEILNFFAVLLISGYVHVPRRRMFWENTADAHNNLVSNAISRDRFEYIFRNIHCCDNASLDKTDKFTKVRPLIKKINYSFQRFAPLQENHSVDEAMIPYFGRHGAKQFIRGKPIRYGYKFWTGAIDSGYVVWIEPYQGAKSEIKVQYRELGLGPSVVLQYAETLLSIRSYPYHIFCDNFFTTIPLTDELKKMNIRLTGTIRENRTSNCNLVSTAEMKKKERGNLDYKSNENGTVVVKWHDNSCVSLASNGVPVYPLYSVNRFSVKEHKK